MLGGTTHKSACSFTKRKDYTNLKDVSKGLFWGSGSVFTVFGHGSWVRPCATVMAVLGGSSLFFNYRICKERKNEMFNSVGSEKVCWSG